LAGPVKAFMRCLFWRSLREIPAYLPFQFGGLVWSPVPPTVALR